MYLLRMCTTNMYLRIRYAYTYANVRVYVVDMLCVEIAVYTACMHDAPVYGHAHTAYTSSGNSAAGST